MNVSRRHFMGVSAALVAGAMASGRAFGANNRIRVCVAGCNGRGGSHIEGFGAIKDCEIAALCDPDSKVLEAKAKKRVRLQEIECVSTGGRECRFEPEESP